MSSFEKDGGASPDDKPTPEERHRVSGQRTEGRAPAAPTRVGEPRHCILPNNMEIAYQSRAEVAFFYKDIFEKRIYLKNGLTLEQGDCVFDIGANIGFFSLFAHQQTGNVRIYAFEPAPPLFEILRLNTSLYGVNVKLFNCGLSDETKTAAFTFYPNSSGMSSFYADKREEKDALKAIMLNQLQQGMSGMEQVMRHADDLLEERLKSLTYECSLRTVSDVMAEYGVARIDFMKIDVQKSELDVLRGIRAEDWPKIKQIVIEVHDTDGRLNQIHGLLKEKGYQVIVEQDDHYENSILYNLYATRPALAPDSLKDFAGAKPLDQASLMRMQERVRKQEEALNRRRQVEGRKKGG